MSDRDWLRLHALRAWLMWGASCLPSGADLPPLGSEPYRFVDE